MATDMQKWIGRTIRLEEQVKGLAGGPQLAKSSIEDGAVLEYDETGQLVASIGKQYDGSHVAIPLAGPIPPAPVAPTCAAAPGVLEVRWNGKFLNNEVSTLDFKNVDVHVSAVGGFAPTVATQQGTIRGEMGDVLVLSPEAGTYYVRLVSRSQTGKTSAPSPDVEIVVPMPADMDVIGGRLDEVQQAADKAASDAAAADAAAGQASTDAATAKTAADQAVVDAAAAAGIANGKGKVLVQGTAPGVADRNVSTLWIDTTGGANTPKRWTTGATWVAVTDKVATDAAAKAATAVSDAAAAKSRADAAFTAAGQAMTAAGQAQTSANGKNNVYYRDVLPSGTGFVAGDTVFIRAAVGQPVTGQYQWDGSAWKPVTMGHQVIASVDLGKATVGELDGVRIKANTVLATSIAIGDFTNLATLDPVRGINTAATEVIGDYAYTRVGQQNYLFLKDRTDTVPFTPADQIRVEFDAVASSPRTVSFALWVYPQGATGSATGNKSSTVSGIQIGTTEEHQSFVVNLAAIPAGAYRSWTMGLQGAGGYSNQVDGIQGVVGVRNVRVYRMNGGSAIVDGAFDARTITGPLIQTVSAPNRGVKFAPEGIKAFNGVGTETFNLSATTGEASFLGKVRSGSVIEGATITGGSIKMDTGNGYTAQMGSWSDGAVLEFRTPNSSGANFPGSIRAGEIDRYGEAGVQTIIHSPTSPNFPGRSSIRLMAGYKPPFVSFEGRYGVFGVNAALVLEAPSQNAILTSNDAGLYVSGGTGGLDLAGDRVTIDNLKMPFRTFVHSAAESVSNNTYTRLTQFTAGEGDHGESWKLTYSGGVATVGAAGVYHIEGLLCFAGGTVGTQHYLAFVVNGKRYRGWQVRVSASGSIVADQSLDVYIPALGTVEMQAYQNSGSAITVPSDWDLTRWSIRKVSI